MHSLPLALILILILAFAVPAAAQPDMVILPAGSRPASAGAADRFTGSVRVEPVIEDRTQGHTTAGRVTFQPGARSAWHTHPLSQWLWVVEGTGITQVEGQPAHLIHVGDAVWCPPNVRHWHGAVRDSAMTHLSVQEALNGRNVQWLEKVTDQQCDAALASAARHP